jgi:hypothetical protein
MSSVELENNQYDALGFGPDIATFHLHYADLGTKFNVPFKTFIEGNNAVIEKIQKNYFEAAIGLSDSSFIFDQTSKITNQK